jgi:hypothetical protein
MEDNFIMKGHRLVDHNYDIDFGQTLSTIFMGIDENDFSIDGL